MGGGGDEEFPSSPLRSRFLYSPLPPYRTPATHARVNIGPSVSLYPGNEVCLGLSNHADTPENVD